MILNCNRTLFLHVSIHGVAVAQGAKARPLAEARFGTLRKSVGSAWRWSVTPVYLHYHMAEARLLDSCLAQLYEAGLAEPTVSLLTSDPID